MTTTINVLYREEDTKSPYQLKQIYFFLTQSCNLRCRHCWIAPEFCRDGQSLGSLDLKIFSAILDQAKPLGLCGVKLSGGEPLLHPRIREVIEQVRNHDLTLAVETNGILCTRELAQAINMCRDASVSVSLDGADAKTHEWMRGVKGCFEAAIQGARNLAEEGINTQVIMSVVRRNKDQLQDVVRLAETLGASSVKFNVVQPMARGDRMRSVGETLAIEELVELGRWVEENLSRSAGVHVSFGFPPAFRTLNGMFGPHGDGCGQCGILNILGVLADGSYALCGVGQIVPELVFGHASRQSLAHVWNTSTVLQELREGLPSCLRGICGDCLMNSVCLGGCVAQNFYSAKDLWAPFWFCEQAAKEGLFPEPRIRKVPSPGSNLGQKRRSKNERLSSRIRKTPDNPSG